MASKKAKGKMAKSRDLMSKKRNQKKTTVSKLLQSFEPQEKVIIKINSAIHSGMPDIVFQGKTGTVIRKQGSCFRVEVNKLKRHCVLIVHPIHLHKVKQEAESHKGKLEAELMSSKERLKWLEKKFYQKNLFHYLK